MKKLLNTLYITDEQSYLTLDGENIVIKTPERDAFRIPFSNVESIFCFSYLGCSPAFMGKCASEGVALNFLSPWGKFLARVTGETKGNVFLRKYQLEKFESSRLSLVQNTVAAKLYNSQALIKNFLHDHPELDNKVDLIELISSLSDSAKSIYDNSNIEIIRGIEGNCAKRYFDGFDALILKRDGFCMVSRTKRPPLDRTNAVLSFLYTIYTCDFASALEGVGLDCYIGYYHTLRPGRCSLACDMVEEVRCMVERFTLSLINLKMLTKKDFDVEVSGATFLNSDGRKKVLSYWQEKKRIELKHPYLKRKIQFGLLPFVQSSLLAKYIRGELAEYPSFLLK